MPIGKNGIDNQGIGNNGIQKKQTLSTANDTVSAGVYDATTLSAVDSDLATGNIKSGKDIFGKAGSADVHNISDADLLVGEARTDKTFYAVSGGKKTATGTVTLASGSSAYPAGYHAGDGGGLVAIDEHFVEGNIADGVEIFGVTGTLAAGISFTDYHYREDMATGVTYTPPVHTQALLTNEYGELDKEEMLVRFYDGGSWIDAHDSTPYEKTCHLFQDTDQNVQVENVSGGALFINLSGVTWAGYSADYHYYEDLAGETTYTPPVKAIASLFNENATLQGSKLHLEFYDGSGWLSAHSETLMESSRMIFQDNGQSLRVADASVGAIKISLTGVIW